MEKETTPGTETAGTSKLENIFSVEEEASSEKEEVEETSETEETEEGEKEEKESIEKAPELTPEQEKEVERRAGEKAKSLTDTTLNSYRDKRETDLKEITRLNDRIKELSVAARTGNDSKLQKILRDSAEEEGEDERKIASRETAVQEFLDREKEYLENKDELAETVNVVTKIAEGIDEDIANEFGLNDANPSVKAKGGMALIAEAVNSLKRYAALMAVLEEVPVLKNGSEVRKTLDETVVRYLNPDLGKEGRSLLLKELKRDFKATPKEKPGTPSSRSSGEDLSKLSPEERMERAIEISDKKKRR